MGESGKLGVVVETKMFFGEFKYRTEEKPFEVIEVVLGRDIKVTTKPVFANVFVAHYVRDGKDIYFLVNIEPEDTRITVEMGNVESVKMYDPYSGGIEKKTLPLDIVGQGYGSVFILSER